MSGKHAPFLPAAWPLTGGSSGIGRTLDKAWFAPSRRVVATAPPMPTAQSALVHDSGEANTQFSLS
jgi:hypothetical protein